MQALLIPILLVVSGLLVGVLIKSLSSFIRLPYTVSLFAFGLLIGILERTGVFEYSKVITNGLSMISDMNPDFILYVFLPILVFDAAYEMNLHVFKKTLLNASILAGPGLVLCMFLTAGLVMAATGFIPGSVMDWTWPMALMFGGLISATDPVAVVALLQELKTNRRFSTLVDGESLLNDGTGIVCFMLFYGTFVGAPTEMNPLLYFGWVCLGSFIIGWIMARLTIWFVTRVAQEEVIQNCAMVIAAYLTFIAAQFFFDISGVIALVVYGHHFAQSGRPLCKPETNEFMSKFWEFMAHIANTLIFIIVGFIVAVKVDITLARCIQLILVYVGVLVIRYIMIMVLFPLIKHVGYGLSLRESVILGWGGLRGALCLSLALMVNNTESIPLGVRQDILFFTAGIVTLTLCINATTSKWLLEKLGLVKAESSARSRMDAMVRSNIRLMDEVKMEELRQDEELGKNAYWPKVEEILPSDVTVPTGEQQGQDVRAALRIKMLEKERSLVVGYYESGRVSKAAYGRMMDAVDDLYDYEGERSLSQRKPIFSLRSDLWLRIMSPILKYIETKRSEKLKPWIVLKKVATRYDQGYGFINIQNECMNLLEHIINESIIDPAENPEAIEQIRQEIQENIDRTVENIRELKECFPKHYAYAVTTKCARIILANERNQVIRMCHEGIISEQDKSVLLDGISSRRDQNHL